MRGEGWGPLVKNSKNGIFVLNKVVRMSVFRVLELEKCLVWSPNPAGPVQIPVA